METMVVCLQLFVQCCKNIAVNSRRPVSIFVGFICGLEEKNTKSDLQIIFPFGFCLRDICFSLFYRVFSGIHAELK